MVVQRELLTAWRSLLQLPPADSDAASMHVTDPHGARATVTPSIEHALQQARAHDAEPIDILVCGSLHLVGGVMAHLREAGAVDERLMSIR